MKKCPKCKAEIQEEARFCLYCMTSFEEKQTIDVPKDKNKRWLPIIAAVLTVAVVFGAVFAFVGRGDATDGDFQSTSSSNDNATSNHQSQTGVASNTESTQSTDNSQGQTTAKSENSTLHNSANATSSSTTTTGVTTSSTSTCDEENKDASTTAPASTTTTSSTATPAVLYYYRDAIPSDDYAGNASITNNAIVITGVETVSQNGIYEIPEKIDGKSVVAIMENAFCDERIKNTVKQIIIPETVKTINAYAFYHCYNLTDIYIKSNAVACPSVIIPEKNKRNFTITIHSSLTCHNRNFYTFKTLCTYWDATYAEWNG